MAQLNDLIVNGYSRFLNSAYGNLNGSATYALTAGYAPFNAGYGLVKENNNTIGINNAGCESDTASNSLALGSHCKALPATTGANNANFAFGNINWVTGTNSLAAGRSNVTYGDFAICLGYGNIGSARYSVNLGNTTLTLNEPISNTAAKTIDRSASAKLTGDWGYCSGDFNFIYKDFPSEDDIMIWNYGKSTEFTGTPNGGQIAIGKYAVAAGRDAIAIGNKAAALAPMSYVFAKGGIATAYGQVVLGSYNKTSPTRQEEIVTIGGGTGENNRYNIAEFRRDGIYFGNNLFFNNANTMVRGSALSALTAEQATKATSSYWSSGTTDLYRPVPFAATGNTAKWNAGQPFDTIQNYDSAFKYNPNLHILSSKYIRTESAYGNTGKFDYIIAKPKVILSGNSFGDYGASVINKKHLMQVPTFWGATALAIGAGPDRYIDSGSCEFYLYENSAVTARLSFSSRLINYPGQKFSFHACGTDSSAKYKRVIIEELNYAVTGYVAGAITRSVGTGGVINLYLGCKVTSSTATQGSMTYSSTNFNVDFYVLPYNNNYVFLGHFY